MQNNNFTKQTKLLLKKISTIFERAKPVKNFTYTEQLSRWKKNSNLYNDWDERTIIMSKYIPEHSSILEFGAARMVLKNYLPDNCTYTPSDLVSRSRDTVVFNLNEDEISTFNYYDVVVFSGVLEYMIDVEKLIFELSFKTSKFIVSYAPIENYSNLQNRKKNGWVNNYKIGDFIKIFESVGFKGEEVANWRGQRIIVFDKTKLS